MIAGYLGERPALSMNKSVLRRVSPKTSGADWHQDGAFLGEGIRSLNVWLTLSRCRYVAPGMDVVRCGSEQIVRPAPTAPLIGRCRRRSSGRGGRRRSRSAHFEAGDALLFDHMFHRTASDRDELRSREWAWFFAPSAYPDDQVRSSSEVVGAAAKARVVSRSARLRGAAALDDSGGPRCSGPGDGRRDPLVPPRRWGCLRRSQASARILDHVLVDAGGLRPDEQVLDIGCGPGLIAAHLTRYLDPASGSYHGFDVMRTIDEHRSRSRPVIELPLQLAGCATTVQPQRLGGRKHVPVPYGDGNSTWPSRCRSTPTCSPFGRELPARDRACLPPGGRALATFFLLNPEAEG